MRAPGGLKPCSFVPICLTCKSEQRPAMRVPSGLHTALIGRAKRMRRLKMSHESGRCVDGGTPTLELH
jgi:hypothetical protein